MIRSINKSCNQGKKTILQGVKHLTLAALICCGSRALAMGQPPRLERQRPVKNLLIDIGVTMAIEDPAQIEDLANSISEPNPSLVNPDQFLAKMTKQYLEEFLTRQHAEHAQTFAQAVHTRIYDGRISQARKTAIINAINQHITELQDKTFIDQWNNFSLTLDPTDVKNAAKKK